jgi:hypothetical protein
MRIPLAAITRLGALAAALATSACVTASVASRPLTMEELSSPAPDQMLEGVIFFPPRPYLLVYHFTQYDGSAPRAPTRSGVAGDSVRCTRSIQRTDLQILPDFAHPRIMVPQRTGIGTARLSVTLSNGMVTAVNSDGASTLADALKALAGGYADVARATKAGVEPAPVAGAPLCNAGPVLAMIVPVDWRALPAVTLPESATAGAKTR